jgi:hypothetical protein
MSLRQSVELTEHSLSRVIAIAQRQSSAGYEHLISRYGHVFDNRRYRIPGLSGTLTAFVVRTVIREHLLRAVPADCDQVIEIVGGRGDNLFHLWLGGGPREAEYLSLEPDHAARAVSIERAKMESGIKFRAAAFDVTAMDGFAGHVNGYKRAFVFTCTALTALPSLPQDFFAQLLSAPGIVGGMHFEQGGWQVAEGPISDQARKYDRKYGRNTDCFRVLADAHRAGRLYVHDFVPNAFAFQALAPFSIAAWMRLARHTNCVDMPFVFSAGGNSGPIRRDGWSDAEHWGCCFDGPEAAVHINLGTQATRELWLVVEARALVEPVTMTVFVKDQRVATWQIAMHRKQYRVALPAEAWSLFDQINIRFRAERCFVPSERGLSSDDRLLSAGLYSLTIASK